MAVQHLYTWCQKRASGSLEPELKTAMWVLELNPANVEELPVFLTWEPVVSNKLISFYFREITPFRYIQCI